MVYVIIRNMAQFRYLFVVQVQFPPTVILAGLLLSAKVNVSLTLKKYLESITWTGKINRKCCRWPLAPVPPANLAWTPCLSWMVIVRVRDRTWSVPCSVARFVGRGKGGHPPVMPICCLCAGVELDECFRYVPLLHCRACDALLPLMMDGVQKHMASSSHQALKKVSACLRTLLLILVFLWWKWLTFQEIPFHFPPF